MKLLDFYGKRPGSITCEMKHKIDTPDGRRTYSKRLGIVELVFGNIRACKRTDKFSFRGQIKVNIQWMLYCLVVPITSNTDKLYPSEAYITFHGKKSKAMADQVTTVSKKRLINAAGTISAAEMEAVGKAIATQLDLSGRTSKSSLHKKPGG